MTELENRIPLAASIGQGTNRTEDAVDMQEAEAWRRAVHGMDRPVTWKGEVVGNKKEYSDRLLECLLRAHRPEKYRERYQVQVAADSESFAECLERARERVRAARDKSGEASWPKDPRGTDSSARV